MRPPNREPVEHPDDGLDPRRDRLTGRGCDELHQPDGPGSVGDRPRHAAAEPGNRHAAPETGNRHAAPETGNRHAAADLVWPDDLAGPGTTDPGGPKPWLDDGQVARSRLGRDQAPAPFGRDDPEPRRGWYAYRVAGPVELPAWAAELALTIERPVDPGAFDAPAQALVLFSAPGRMRWLAGIAEAAAEVEHAAGLRPVAGVGRWANGRVGGPARPLPGPALPGLVPVPPAVAWAELRAAGARGLPAPLRRWRPATGGVDLSWQSSAGSVLTCEGPCGVSAQAVVALRGPGDDLTAIMPPPGGALVLRAWRAGRSWGVACGLVLGSGEAIGLGREAGRTAARARAAGWEAVVLKGSAALDLARAGSPEQPAPETASSAASGPQVTALFEACLAAGAPELPVARPAWPLVITP